MRNWNVNLWKALKDLAVSFEPTYEELKLWPHQLINVLFAMFWAYLWGIETITGKVKPFTNWVSFEPTYEELKLLYWKAQGPGWESFEPTYEELKLTEAMLEWLQFIQVLSLPMRNWNSKREKRYISGMLVLSLPMRNWNSSYTIFYMPWPFVLSLPMRNWNPSMWWATQSGYKVLSLPMRNWNKKVR